MDEGEGGLFLKKRRVVISVWVYLDGVWYTRRWWWGWQRMVHIVLVLVAVVVGGGVIVGGLVVLMVGYPRR